MKRVRSEQLQALVLSHLKQRNFTDSEASFKANCTFQESLKSMAVRSSKARDISNRNVASLGPFTLDEYFTSFVHFSVFVKQLISKNISTDIKDLLFPMFAHLYLDLILSGRDEDADVFYQKFATDASLKSVDTNLIFEELARVSTKSGLLNSPKVLEYSNKKCSIRLSEESHDLLLRFFHSQSCLVLHYIMNRHIIITVPSKDSSVYEFKLSDFKHSALHKQNKTPVVKKEETSLENSPASTSINSNNSFMMSPGGSQHNEGGGEILPDVDETTWRNCVKKITEAKPVVSDVCVYRFQQSPIGLTHTTISNSQQWISTGFENSTIKLWNCNTLQDAKKSKSSSNENTDCINNPNTSTINDEYPDISKVHLGCDSWKVIKDNLCKTNEACTNKNYNVLRGHSGPVYSSTFTHDDKYLLSCSADTTVRLWDVATCKNRVIYNGHSHPVWSISMSSLSMYFATGSFDRTARLWSTERTFPLRIFAGHTSSVGCVGFHANSSYLASADRTIRLWDIASGKTVRIMTGHWASILCLAFSCNGKYLASSGEDRRIRMWDIASGALIKEMRGHSSSVLSLSFSPDDQMLASCGMDSALKVWNTRTTQTQNTRNYTDVDDPNLNPDLIATWKFTKGSVLHSIKFQSCNLIHCTSNQL